MKLSTQKKQAIAESYQNLANAIVEQAAEDYREALIKYKSKGKKSELKKINSLEKFFKSKYYGCLTNVNGSYIVNKLKTEIYGS